MVIKQAWIDACRWAGACKKALDEVRAGDSLSSVPNDSLAWVWELQGFSARTKAPDIDNLVKQVMEALEDAGVVANDQQVAHVEAEKIGHKPKAKPKGKTE